MPPEEAMERVRARVSVYLCGDCRWESKDRWDVQNAHHEGHKNDDTTETS